MYGQKTESRPGDWAYYITCQLLWPHPLNILTHITIRLYKYYQHFKSSQLHMQQKLNIVHKDQHLVSLIIKSVAD